MSPTRDEVLGKISYQGRADIEGVQLLLATLNDEERLVLMEYVADGYCMKCGIKLSGPTCYCDADNY